MPTTQRKRSNILLPIALAILLGLGGYFVTTMLLTGRGAGGADELPVSDIPTDSDGNNLYGNSPQNLYAGGLMAMQGEDLFYINPGDGGALYCRARDGEITKLTDFAVANLNVSGERLVFTDLENCAITRENGEVDVFSADSHFDLLDEAGDEERIQFGGRLYIIMGIKSFCAGKLSEEDLTLTELDTEKRYLSPVLTEGGDLLMITLSQEGGAGSGGGVAPSPASGILDIASALRPLSATGAPAARTVALKPTGVAYTPDSLMVVGANGAMNKIDFTPPGGEKILAATIAGNNIIVSTGDTVSGENYGITLLDKSTGKAFAVTGGHSLQTDGENAYYINAGILFRLNQDGTVVQVSKTPCDSTIYELGENGDVRYRTFDPTTGEHVTVLARIVNREYKAFSDQSFKEALTGTRNLNAGFGGKYYTLDKGVGWFPFVGDKDSQLTKPLDWIARSREAAKLRKNKLAPPGLIEMWSDGNAPQGSNSSTPPSSSAPPSSSSSAPPPDPDYGTEDDIALDLAAIINIMQGYGYDQQSISAGFSRDEYAKLLDIADNRGITLNNSGFLEDSVNNVLAVFGLDSSQTADYRESVEYWLKTLNFSVTNGSINNDSGTVDIVIFERVHITTENLSTAFAASVNAYPGGAAALRAMGKDNFMQWFMPELLRLTQDAYKAGFVEELSQPIVIPMRHTEAGWIPESYTVLWSELFVVDTDLTIDEALLRALVGNSPADTGLAGGLVGYYGATDISPNIYLRFFEDGDVMLVLTMGSPFETVQGWLEKSRANEPIREGNMVWHPALGTYTVSGDSFSCSINTYSENNSTGLYTIKGTINADGSLTFLLTTESGDGPGQAVAKRLDSLPASNNGLDGKWVRSGMPQAEWLVFSGSRIEWYMFGRLAHAGTYEVRGDSIFLDLGPNGSQTFSFSQGGSSLTMNGWEFERG